VNLLLDTATFLWVSYDAEKLSPAARSAYANPDNQLHLSVVSLWEIILKNRLGKLQIPVPVEQLIAPLKESHTVTILPLNDTAVMHLQSLPDIHRDPFDRMLVCRAIDLGLALLTPDSTIRAYPVQALW
jgi:PIN domain nuclease of toxin-antitoxin system